MASIVECGYCGGHADSIGILGKSEHYICRNCGIQFHLDSEDNMNDDFYGDDFYDDFDEYDYEDEYDDYGDYPEYADSGYDYLDDDWDM